ncbi:MAG: type IX secretion system membrane protein PorP/SprF, partial [Bacteroidia bacterium]
MRKLLLLIILFFSVLCVKAQQDNLYSQYMFNGLLLNPAYAGSNEVLSATALNRNQWVGFDGAPKTSTFSLHTPLKNKKVNVGITFINDRFGITTQNKINAVYAYRLFFKKSSLSFGLQAGVDLIKNNYNAIQTTTPNDAVFTGQFSQQNIPQFGFGIYYKTKTFYAGISSPDLLSISTSTSTYKSMFLTA